MSVISPMHPGARAALWCLALAVLGGCSAIRNQVKSDIELADACEDIMANQAGYVATSKEAYIKLVSHRVLGDVALCSDGNAPPSIQSVLFCGLNDDLAKNLALQSDAFAGFKPRFQEQLEKINLSVARIKASVNVMKASWPSRADCVRVSECARQYSEFMRQPANVDAAADIVRQQEQIAKAVDQIQLLANAVEVKVMEAGQQDQILLLADAKRFVVNAKSFLGTSRRALAGDVAMVTRDAVLNNIYYQLSHRILDSLDTSLARAERMLDKADDKLYGAVSLSMVGGRSAIQLGFDRAVTSMVCKASGGKPPQRAAFALAQAVCERIATPNRNVKSYLAPLIEASFVKAVHYANKSKGEGLADLETECAKAPDGEVAAGNVPLRDSDINGSLPGDTLTFGVYMAHEWATGLALTSVAPQEMTRSQMAAADKAGVAVEKQKIDDADLMGPLHPAAAGAVMMLPVGPAIPATEPAASPRAVESVVRSRLVATLPARDAVRQIALSSSAAAISEFQAGHSGGDHSALQGHLVDAASVKSIVTTFVNTQSQSVQITMTANAVQNVNVAPAAPQAAPHVIVVPALLPGNAEGADLCDTVSAQFRCLRRANGSYEIVASRFSAGAYRDSALETLLVNVSRASGSAARGYDAVITGSASIAEFSCQQVGKWRTEAGVGELFPGMKISDAGPKAYKMSYRGGRVTASVACNSERKAGGNHLLSFARAAWASSLLGQAPGALIRTVDVAGLGANYARTMDMDEDRNVTIRLFPR